ncbi:MAG: C-GCAxxG-C-C family protein [Cellulosilyticaceae bacterium]
MKKQVDLEEVRRVAEGYYRDGDFYCSEAIVKTIKDVFELPISDEVIAAASGFPVGMGGSGCTCGAVAGGVMALGLVFGRTQAKDKKVDKAMALSRELHEIFREKHKSVCCRVLTKGMRLGSSKHMKQCIDLTGEVAVEVAQLIMRDI